MPKIKQLAYKFDRLLRAIDSDVVHNELPPDYAKGLRDRILIARESETKEVRQRMYKSLRAERDDRLADETQAATTDALDINLKTATFAERYINAKIEKHFVNDDISEEEYDWFFKDYPQGTEKPNEHSTEFIELVKKQYIKYHEIRTKFHRPEKSMLDLVSTEEPEQPKESAKRVKPVLAAFEPKLDALDQDQAAVRNPAVKFAAGVNFLKQKRYDGLNRAELRAAAVKLTNEISIAAREDKTIDLHEAELLSRWIRSARDDLGYPIYLDLERFREILENGYEQLVGLRRGHESQQGDPPKATAQPKGPEHGTRP